MSKSFNSETALERSPVDMEGESYAASRRRARTVAMQVLYEVDSVGHPLGGRQQPSSEGRGTAH